jgi:hypothetical protein
MAAPAPTHYRDFWPYYVGAHRRTGTRLLHFGGTSAGLALLVIGPLVGPLWLLAFAPVTGYGLAWLGHALVEHNRPATFRHPLWSLIGDVHMYGLMWVGRMDQEIIRLDLEGKLPFDAHSAELNNW